MGGFYAVYGMVFNQIFEAEVQGQDGSDNDDFGTSQSLWEDITKFYQSWESFTTNLSFAWADVYDIKEAPNRKVRRIMEDENKKARRNAKRDRNEDVLALVHFVKRRDPRVKKQQKLMQEQKILEKKKKDEQQRQKKIETKQA